MSDTQIHKYKYTNTQYTHTVLVKLSDRPMRGYNFEKVMVRGLQKQCFQIQSGTIRYNQVQSGKISYNQAQSGKIRYNQVQSSTIRYNQAQSGTIR